MKNVLILIVCTLLGVVGCTTPGGKSKFSCPTPDGVACKSVREMYAITDAEGEAGLAQARRALHAGDEGGGKRDRREVPVTVVAQPPVMVLEPQADLPLREKPRVMRVLVSAWEDESGDLHGGGYVFTEVEGPRWTLAERRGQRATSVQPLQFEIAGRDGKQVNAGSGAKAAVPGKESAEAPSAKSSERSSDDGGS